jgi:predicted glycosyltransferase
MDDIAIPVVYTGYICEQSDPGAGSALKDQLRLQPGEKLIVVSAGGGNVGYSLLDAAIKAYDLLQFPVRMHIFTGPYLPADDFASLKQKTVPGVRIQRFIDNFPAWLAAADLSISMGGYNTSMNVLAAGTPALILPFAQNREQRLRTERLAAISGITMLEESELSPGVMAENITAMLAQTKKTPPVLLDGAEKTNQWLSRWMSEGTMA